MNKKTQHVINTLMPFFENDRAIDEVRIFGSQVRGNYSESSDVDLAIISDNLNNVKFGLLHRIAVDNNLDVDFVYTNRDKLTLSKYELDVNYWIHREGVTIWKR